MNTDLQNKITSHNRMLLVTRHGYTQDLVDTLDDETANALRRAHYAIDERAGVSYCGWCGKLSHGRCD